MRHTSVEYATLRKDLDDWFGQTKCEPTVIAQTEGAQGQGWELRGGFIGDDHVSCSGLAVVIRRGLAGHRGLFRVDMYEPNEPQHLPPAGSMAGRIEYAPHRAGFTYSKRPDAAPVHPVYDDQFRVMRRLLSFVEREPAALEDLQNWADSYQESALLSEPGTSSQPFLRLLANHLPPPFLGVYGEQAA